MQDKFLESIRTGFISKIEEIIQHDSTSAKEEGLNAIDTLILINEDIRSWISSVSEVIYVDEELLREIAAAKRPFVKAAKKEVAEKVSQIIENESSDVTEKISKFMNGLKEMGVDLDEETETRRNTHTSDSLEKLRVLRRKHSVSSPSERTTSSYNTSTSSSCDESSGCSGGSGGCGGGGC